MLCVPVASALVVNFATSALKVTVFRSVVPSLNVTLPMGVPLNCGVTLAVNVTDCPTFDGFSEETREVVVVALFTACFTIFDLLPPKFESPPYTAVIALVAAGSVEIVKVEGGVLGRAR